MVVRDRGPDDIDRDPNTKMPVGDEGSPQRQSDGKQVHRKGAEAEQADFDVIDEDGNAWDLADDGDFVIPDDTDLEENPDTGGASNLNVAIQSDDNSDFNVEVEWQDSDGNTLYVNEPSKAGQGDLSGPDVNVSIFTFGDQWKLTVTDKSGNANNRVTGSVNAH